MPAGKTVFQKFGSVFRVVRSRTVNMPVKMDRTVMRGIPFQNGIMEQDDPAVCSFKLLVMLNGLENTILPILLIVVAIYKMDLPALDPISKRIHLLP